MAAAQSPEFKDAAEKSRKLKALPTNEELLEGSQDPPFESATKPGMFDLKGKAKYNAWKKVVDDGVTPEQAQEKYIALIKSLGEKYGWQE